MKKPEIFGSDYLRKIPIKDNSEDLVDTAMLCPDLLFDIASYLVGDEAQLKARFVRAKIADMINVAISYLPNDKTIVLRCGWRDPEIQRQRYNKIKKQIMSDHPHWNNSQIQRRLDECVAPPDVAPHCTGGAIDVFPADKKGKLINIGCKPGEFTERTYTYSDKISEVERKNRAIFIDALNKAGFNNFPGEIWHWSYGEIDWAAYQKKPFAIYGPVNL